MTRARRWVSGMLWGFGLVCAALAAVIAPRVRRLEVDGATLRPICEEPREQVLAPPPEWCDGLRLWATFKHREVRA